MKTKIKAEQGIEINIIHVILPVAYEEEDIPNDFPMRRGDMWEANILIDTGKIVEWPQGKTGHLFMKVCDGGTYRLIRNDGSCVAQIIQDYVPNGIIPGEFGDYVDLRINAEGIITNWPKKPDVSAFFGEEQ